MIIRRLPCENYLVSPQELTVEGIVIEKKITRKRIREQRMEIQVLKVKIKVEFLMKGQDEEEVTVVTISL